MPNREYEITVKFKCDYPGIKDIDHMISTFMFVLGRWCGAAKALFNDNYNITVGPVTVDEIEYKLKENE